MGKTNGWDSGHLGRVTAIVAGKKPYNKNLIEFSGFLPPGHAKDAPSSSPDDDDDDDDGHPIGRRSLGRAIG